MNWQRALTIGSVSVAVLGSAMWIVSRRNAAPPVVAPTAVASDVFDQWVQPAEWPSGLVVLDSLQCTLTAFMDRSDSLTVWHATTEPVALPGGWSSQAWQGGWLLGPDVAAWNEGAGIMALYWKPRTGGRTTQVLLPGEQWNRGTNALMRPRAQNDGSFNPASKEGAVAPCLPIGRDGMSNWDKKVWERL